MKTAKLQISCQQSNSCHFHSLVLPLYTHFKAAHGAADAGNTRSLRRVMQLVPVAVRPKVGRAAGAKAAAEDSSAAAQNERIFAIDFLKLIDFLKRLQKMLRHIFAYCRGGVPSYTMVRDEWKKIFHGKCFVQ